MRFLFEIKKIKHKERQKFLKELEEKTGQKAGEVWMMLLDRLDNMNKPKIIANLLKAKVKNQIKINEFLRLATIVDKAYIGDLKKLNSFVRISGDYI